MEPRGAEVDGTAQASGKSQPSDGKRAYFMADDATRFLRELRQLRSEAGLESAELAARAHYPHDVIVAAEIGPGLPELPVLSAYVRGCGPGDRGQDPPLVLGIDGRGVVRGLRACFG